MPSGKLPDGTTFEGPSGICPVIADQVSADEFISTFTSKLLTYALGRGLEYYDNPALRAIVRQAQGDDKQDNITIPALIQSIVKSPQFQMRRTPQS